MEFRNLTTEEFNSEFRTNLDEDMTFHQADTEIESNGISYFYISMYSKDVEEAIKEEQDIADQLNLDLICISDLGIYIATY